MGSKTVYTSTITVPVYAGWKCAKCQEKNFAEGVIACRKQTQSSSLRKSKLTEAEAKASELARAAWMDNALTIMTDPTNHPIEVRNDLFLGNTNCTKCGAKPEWDKDTKYLGWMSLALLPAFISGFVAIALKTSIIAWLVFAAFLGVFVYAFYTESHYKKIMANLPKQFTPVIGSLNEELIEYAKEKGVTIPDPNEVMKIVDSDGEWPSISKTDNSPVIDTIECEDKEPQLDKGSKIQYGFCRKCGAQLLADSGFCHKCGTKIAEE